MRPLRRSLFFWLGIIPGLFLVWSWVDSIFHHRYASIPFSGRCLIAGHYLGQAGCVLTASAVASKDFELTSEAIPWGLERPFFPGPEWEENTWGSSSLSGKERRLLIPHWMLLSAWGVVFLIALDVRQKILQEKNELPDEDAPSADH